MPKRDLLVLLKTEFMSQRAIELQVEGLNEMLQTAESDEQFCRVHELARRNKISSRPSRILEAVRHSELKPFHFLINKN